MRWDAERYVKVYRRDTAEWCAVSWQARGLFYELLRKADRHGQIACGKMDPVAAVAILVRGTRSDVAAPLRELLDDGCIEDVSPHGRVGHHLAIRNYREAQGENETSAERMRRLRERRAETQEESEQVTDCDANVTRDSPSRAEPNHPIRSEPTTAATSAATVAKPATLSLLPVGATVADEQPAPKREAGETPDAKPRASPASSSKRPDADSPQGRCFAHWRDVAWPRLVSGVPYPEKREDFVQLAASLRKLTEAQVCLAMDRAVADDWWRERGLNLATVCAKASTFLSKADQGTQRLAHVAARAPIAAITEEEGGYVKVR